MNRNPFQPASRAAVFGLGLTLLPATASSQDMNPEVLSGLSSMIRWGGVMTSLLIIALGWLALRVLKATVERLSGRFAARRLLIQKLATVVQFVVYLVVAVITIALSFSLDDRILALVGGTIAVSVGFALKDLVASLFAAVTIMFDRPFQVGDRVAFGGFYGDITAIGLRSVRLQTLDDNTVTIPNNKFLSDITSSGNYGELDMMVVMDYYIEPNQDIEKAIDIIRQCVITSKFIHLPKPVSVNISQQALAEHFVIRARAKAYVLDTKYEKSFESDVTLRVLTHFREAGISLAA